MNAILWLTSAAFAGVAALPRLALADDLPSLRKGIWEYGRSVEDSKAAGKPMNLTNKKCADPSADMRKMNAAIEKQGCKFSPVAKAGNTYTFTSECQIQGVTAQSRSVMTVESDSAYKVDVTSTGGGRSTKELLIAKRLGDC
jgi:hypothetical protein